ncbi:3'(2'),5'-bisphosphate nucleotidase CysQ [Marinobacterium jannaschii]|uniref:3'(2'),5'-bisphosphate nucleotidase CysQ n=1 Tax=Marinobacterium jannaschii TaxID=64970 RepID=UPI000684153E|nr:3'(2'),5'-bisphosphate nucleotidase CysQ [Marinobacterium jannaschii]
MPIGPQQLKTLQAICDEAGRAIMQVYRREDVGIRQKDDNSPLTEADLAANRIIEQGLGLLTPDIPRLSEESGDEAFHQRRQWQRYWCIDPLDGTKEFINRNDEFTVNIALIDAGRPLFGIIHMPVTGTSYWGGEGMGAWMQQADQAAEPIRCQPLGEKLTLIASRRHGQEKTAALLACLKDEFREIAEVNIGSSLKMCLIAEGKADLYPRLHPTSEWDTAAAQAIVEAAGGQLLDAHSLQPLSYNQRDSLINPWFLVIGDPAFPLDRLVIEPPEDA